MGLSSFRRARLSANMVFSPPTSSPQWYFHADPKERIIALEVMDSNWLQGMVRL
jgi:hypothetical protein